MFASGDVMAGALRRRGSAAGGFPETWFHVVQCGRAHGLVAQSSPADRVGYRRAPRGRCATDQRMPREQLFRGPAGGLRKRPLAGRREALQIPIESVRKPNLDLDHEDGTSTPPSRQCQVLIQPLSHSEGSDTGAMTSPWISTEPFIEPSQRDAGLGAGGMILAIGCPRRVIRIGSRVWATRSNTAKQVALNFEI